MADIKSLKPLPPALPETANEMLALRALKKERKLNDMIEDIYLSLAEDKQFKALVYAIYNSQAVEGSLFADDILAAQMIKARSIKIYQEVAHTKLATIRSCMLVVQRRYHLSRKERRYTVGGAMVSPEDIDAPGRNDIDDNGVE